MRTARPKSMHHQVVGVEAEEQVREDEVVVDAATILFGHPFQRWAFRVSGPHHRGVVFRELHEAAVEVGSPRFTHEIRGVGSRRIVGDSVQLGMNRGAVVTFGVVLSEDFPICFDLVGPPGSLAQAFEVKPREPREEFAHLLAEGGTGVVEARPNEAAPCVHADRAETVLFLRKIHESLRVGSAHEPSLRRIRPRMVWANQGSELGPLRLADDSGPSVAADVVESPHLVVLASDEEEGLVADLSNEEVPGIRDLVRATDIQPAPEEETLELLEENRVVPERSPGQQGAGGEVLPDPAARGSLRHSNFLHLFRTRTPTIHLELSVTQRSRNRFRVVFSGRVSSRGSVLAARGASTFPSAVAEPFLFGPRIFRPPFLSFHALA